MNTFQPPLLLLVLNGNSGPSVWMILPFGILLAAIALMPFINKHWWEHHYHHVSAVLGALVLFYYVLGLHAGERMIHVGYEYLSFITLIGSLFVVAGGVHIRFRGESTPWQNAAFLTAAAVLSNVIGTTGASMLLIRPWIRMNKYRISAFHIVFFIFIVSNVGGALTPIGDPPLFLGYLKGVPFWWELQNLWQPWLLTIVLLVTVFYAFDRRSYMKAPEKIRAQAGEEDSWKFLGMHNLIFLAVILGSVFLASPWREIIMVAAAAGSYFTTAAQVHGANEFNFAPIKEVAWLFLGIFATMVPALDYLALHARDLGVDTALKFYFLTGSLSGVLDNAPTYLTFLTASISQHTAVDGHTLSLDNLRDLEAYTKLHGTELMAISLGAVFFGAMTYIGNGPNFMVKSIADQSKVHTPGFFAYVIKYSLPILLPILALVGWIYFR
jgi:Na+/H+ antiporter NhaD/arsenite permease-like protein